MKPKSFVLPQLQKPLTIFGIPVQLLMLTIAIAALGFLFCIFKKFVGISFIVFLAIFVSGILLSYKLAKKDCHVITVFLTTLAFWKCKKNKILITSERGQK